MSLAEKFGSLSMNSDIIMGGSSKLDEVFLPLNMNNDSRGEMEPLQKQDQSNNILSSQANFLDNLVSGATENASTSKCYQASIASFVMIAVVISALIFGHQFIKDLLMWLTEVDFFISYAIFLALHIVVSFPIAWGYVLLMVSAGYLYSYIYGPLVILSGGLLGVFISHVTMRNCCRSYFYRKFYNGKVEAVIKVVESDQGFKVIALARLTPIPFGLQNGLFALADVPLWKYCLASVVGLLPMAVLNCYLGSTLRSMEDVLGDGSNKTTGYFIFAAQLLFTAGVIFFVVRKARVELRKTVVDLKEEKHAPNTDDVYVDMNNES
ncbi:transmembrane protein 64-like [Haliotis cracherodii]|uniref:transmembrane protein 64-like n=1 Tax=Haliotis cracherodii TaxID=6455 RepID=UPI0039E74F4C